MRTIFYITAILFVLSGCKGNAFLKQRYTHFSHGSARIENKPVIADYKQIPATLALLDRRDEQATEPVLYTSVNKVPDEASLILVDKRVNTTSFKNSSLGQQKLSGNNKGVTKYTKLVKHQFKKVNDSKRGIIGTLLKIILSIIILAIVVGVVIIVLTLA